ncbi:hypothetical protein [Adhaeribacter rhizoryzae]|uniref:Partitioning protein ParB n=1 Tax=Adhaeribacter rhizoryzae TaxID=2607907 RepID=A0A5M6D1X2_9BACT|nr:hypothetical protein [Adhaeribacter rhizoryzae]KAA5539125.1 hypothetical protein F0145_24980 [Adhaeribacter rhizoryzae]
MAKKNFSGGLGKLLQSTTENAEQEEVQEANEAVEPTKFPERRTTFVIREDYLDKISAIAYWDRTLLKDQINAALSAYIEEYEKKNGEIKVAPPKRK